MKKYLFWFITFTSTVVAAYLIIRWLRRQFEMAEMRTLAKLKTLQAQKIALEAAKRPEPGFKGLIALSTPTV
jgi:hypothetical protein